MVVRVYTSAFQFKLFFTVSGSDTHTEDAILRFILFVTSNFYGRPMQQGRPLYFCPVVSSSFFFFFFFFPRLISAVAEWMSTILLHMVWPYCEFRMQVWNVLHAARWKYRTQIDAKKSPSGHHRTTLSGWIFARHVSTIGKELVKQQYCTSSTQRFR